MINNDLLQEYYNCLTDISYFAINYCRAFDQTNGGFVKLKVFPRQKDLLNQLQESRYNIVLKPRQAGVSTISALYCAHLILFATEESPQRILIVANKRDTAKEFLTKIQGYIASAPEWLGLHRVVNKNGDTSPYHTNNSNIFVLNNGSGAKAVGTSNDALRGYTPTMLVLDEAAFIRGADDLWASAAASLSTGGRALFISTPNGQDPLYHKTYQQSLKGESDFKIFDMYWWQDPRFNKDLSFVKPKVIEYENEDGIRVKEVLKERCYAIKFDDGTWDFDDVRRLIREKWEPTSMWFEGMCKTLNGDERKIAQELKTIFSGSGDNVIKDEYIMNQEINTLPPISTDGFDNNVWIWEEPIAGHQYLLGSDVSRGDADDYSTFTIFDAITGNQVLEWQGKCPPDVLGEMINEYGTKYQAYAVIDITGGLGEATVIKLRELNYPWIHKTNKSGKVGGNINVKDADLIWGFMISKNRTLIINTLEEAIRNNTVTIRSKRLIDELKTFEYINGRPDHKKGYHDDLIFAVAMALFVKEFSFKLIKKYKEKTKAMLDAWINHNSDRANIRVHGEIIDPRDPTNGNGWLFG